MPKVSGGEYLFIDKEKTAEILKGTGRSYELISEMLGKSKGWLSNIVSTTGKMEKNDIEKIERFFDVSMTPALKDNQQRCANAERQITAEDVDRLIEALDRHSATIAEALNKHSDTLSDDVSRMVNTWMRLTEKMEGWLK